MAGQKDIDAGVIFMFAPYQAVENAANKQLRAADQTINTPFMTLLKSSALTFLVELHGDK
ncbi:hypothetical protein DPMN_140570 [Dreissena polymorpha]|uniref:Uncharacterized protein n=1 Tax=Dreissena polymorpha TaxID=45954 RepID=A0A9D4GDS2_DREPO|nr:hypothetical protein DPMN_140570 [Dreissena polymorpha]